MSLQGRRLIGFTAKFHAEVGVSPTENIKELGIIVDGTGFCDLATHSTLSQFTDMTVDVYSGLLQQQT